MDHVARFIFTSLSNPLSPWLQPEFDLAARPAVQERTLTAAKNTTALQASGSGSLFVTIATKIVSAAIADMRAIARPHR